MIWQSLPLFAAAPEAAAQELGAPPVIARVNGEAIFVDDLERHLSRVHGEVAAGERGGFDLDRLMFRVINDALIGQEARALGMAEEPGVVEKVEEFRNGLARDRLRAEEIDRRSEPTDEEVRRMFEDQYRRVTFRVVTAYERETSEELLAELQAGADLETLATQRSVDPYRLRGGLVQRLARIDLQREVGELLFSLEPGELGGPVITDLGWSLVRPLSFEQADPERFAEVERIVSGLVRLRKANLARAALATTLRDRYEVMIDQAAVDAIQPRREPDGRLLPDDPAPDVVVATIGEVATITGEEYASELLARWKGVRNLEAALTAKPIVLEKMIERHLLLAEALRRGYADSPAARRVTRSYETQLIVPRFLEEIVAADIEVDREEMLAFYEEHKEGYHRPPRVRLGQITVADRVEADRVAEQLRGSADLAWLARRQSIDRYKESGGDRGWYVPQAGMDDFNRELFDAPVGAVLEPFGVEGNWIVLKVVDRREQGIYEFDEVSGNVRQAVFSQKFQAALDAFIKKLRSRSEISVDETALASLRIGGSRTETPQEGAAHVH